MNAAVVVGWLWFAGMVAALVEVLIPKARGVVFGLGLASLAGVIFLVILQWPGELFMELADEGVRLDGFALFVQVLVLVGALGSLLIGQGSETGSRPGTTGLVLMSTAGAALFTVAADMVLILTGFVGSLIPLWGLAAISPGENGREAALKGLVVCALGAGLFGLGAAMLVVQTATTNLAGIGHHLACIDWIGSDPILVASLVCILGGMGCMVAAVPFHMWFVDVMEGLPTPGAMLLSGGVMVAGLAAAIRVLLVSFLPVVASGHAYLGLTSVLHGLGMLALLVCNAMALVQRRFKRMAAYLAAGQVGFVWVTLAAVFEMGVEQAASTRALGGVLVFMAVHVVCWVGLFVAEAAIDDRDGLDPTVGRLEGLAQRHPWLALATGLALLCMAGMPPTAGFFSRLYLLEALVDAGWTGTAVAAALSLGLVLVMGLGLVAAMVLRSADSSGPLRASLGVKLVAVLSSVAILLLGILPGGILEIAIRSARSIWMGD